MAVTHGKKNKGLTQVSEYNHLAHRALLLTVLRVSQVAARDALRVNCKGHWVLDKTCTRIEHHIWGYGWADNW